MRSFRPVIVTFFILFFMLIGFLFFTGKGVRVRTKAKMALLGTGFIKPDINSISISDARDFDFNQVFFDPNGSEINLGSFKGKTLFINVWASWCGPCKQEMPYIQSLYEKLADHPDIAFLMLAVDKDFQKSISFIEKNAFSFPFYHMPETENTSLKTGVIPMTLVVNPDGKIVYKEKQMNNFDTPEFKEFLLAGGLVLDN